jgi:hypothetical protein
VPPLDDQVDRLYGLPLDRFTEARNALARELTRAGDREGAGAVRALRKPSLSAWALNQLSRSCPDDVERLLAAGADLRAAQARALDGDPSQLRRARQEEDEQVQAMAGRAASQMAEAGRPASPAQHERLTATLRAAATNDEASELLRHGRLVHDLEPAGFGFGELDEIDVVRRRPARERSTPDVSADTPDRERERRAARREARRLASEADRATARAERLAREAADAERHAAELRRRADEAFEDASAAQRTAAEADRAARLE